MTIVPLKYIPADKFESRWFDGMVLIVMISVAGILIGTAMDLLGIIYSGWFMFYGIIGGDLMLLGWCIANAIAHVELQKSLPKPSAEEIKKSMEAKGFHFKEEKQ